MNYEDIIRDIEAQAEAVLEGHRSPTAVYIELRGILAAAAEALKKIEATTMVEVLKYGKTAELHGHIWTVSQGRKTYKYDHIREWSEAKAKLSAIEERAKTAAIIAEKGLGMHAGDGEVMEPAQVTHGKAFISIRPA